MCYRCLGYLALPGILLLISGCRNDSIVLHEDVPVTRSIAEAQEPKFQMTTAIVERPDATWFLKLTGPIDGMEQVREAWALFLDSVRFPDREPEWELPAGWLSGGFEEKAIPGGASMRIANIATTHPEVSVSISSLFAGQELLPNVNRWRGQLGLNPINALQLETQLSETSNAEVTFRIFEAQGPTLSTRMSGGPFSGGAASTSPHPGMSGQTTLPTDSSQPAFAFDPPEGWEAGPTSSMIVGKWTRDDEAGSAELMLMKMNPTDESWRMNVEAWAGQVKSESVPVIDEVTESFQVDGATARRVRLNGPNAESDDNPTVVAAMFQDPEGNGFVLKLSGGKVAVAAAIADFDQLLNSIQFQNPAG